MDDIMTITDETNQTTENECKSLPKFFNKSSLESITIRNLIDDDKLQKERKIKSENKGINTNIVKMSKIISPSVQLLF